MAGNPYYQDLDPAGTPPNFTPTASPSSPSNYAGVATQGMDIQAADGVAGVTAAFNDSIAVGGAGVLYPMSPRNQDARTFLESPQGFASDGFDIFGGFHGGGGAGWPADVEPDVAGP